MGKLSPARKTFLETHRFLVFFCHSLKDRKLSGHILGEIDKLHQIFIDWLVVGTKSDPRNDKIIFQINNLINLAVFFESSDESDRILAFEAEKRLLELKLETILATKRTKPATKPHKKEVKERDDQEQKFDRDIFRQRIMALFSQKDFINHADILRVFPELNERSLRRLMDRFSQEGLFAKKKNGNVVTYFLKKGDF